MNASDPRDALHATRAWVFDVDGCLMRTTRAGGVGGEAMPRAGELLSALRGAGHTVVLCTNASERPPQEYAAHLGDKGIEVADEDFVTAGSAAADHVTTHHPGARVLVVGDDGITDPLRRLGLEPIGATSTHADVVVVGAAPAYEAETINAACLAVDAGAAFYTTVATPWFHGGLARSVAVTAAVAHAIAWVTGTEPRTLGKPSASLAQTLLRRLPVPAERAAVVGDADAEIKLARAMGATSALVLSGAISAERLAAFPGEDRPDVVIQDVAELYDLLFPSNPLSQGALP